MSTSTTPPEAAPRNGSYIDVDGIRTYYEVTGAGDPLVLLHGGLAPAETFDPQVPALAEEHRVYVPERFGHGRTPDIDGPLSYEVMASHTIAWMESLGIESAHLVGWSDGALVAVLVALRRPKLVRKLVLIDQFVTLAGAVPAYQGFMDAFTPDTAPPGLPELYGALSPDGPDHFSVVFDKLHRMWTEDTGVEVADLANVAAPTLILNGDDGCMRLTHADELCRTLPDAQLAVVPGASHGLTMEKAALVNRLILDFLAEDQPPKIMGFDPR